MHKTLTIAFLILFFLQRLHAQKCDTSSFQHVYSIYGTSQSPAVAVMPGENNESYLAGNVLVQDGYPPDGRPNYRNNVYITKLNSKGTPLWTKMTKDLDRTALVINAARSFDGSFLLTGIIMSDDHPEKNSGWLAKFNANGNILWQYVLGTPLSNFVHAIMVKDGGIVITGTLEYEYAFDGPIQKIGKNHAIIIKLDADGKEVWGRDFYNNVVALGGATLQCVIQANDGSIIASGSKDAGIKEGPQQTTKGFLIKLDNADGHTIWQTHSADVSGNESLSQLGNGTLVMRDDSNIYFADPQTGSLLGASSFMADGQYGVNYQFYYAGSIADGKDIYYTFSNRVNMLVFEVDDYNSIKWIKSADPYNADGHVAVLRSAATQRGANEGSIYITGDYNKTDTLNYLTFLFKIGADGQSPCLDTFTGLNLVFHSPAPAPLTTFTWLQERPAGAETGKVFLADEPMFTYNKLYCYSTACCRDTTIMINAKICQGSNYLLPDGSKINKPGRYSFLYKRSTGCDSIIFVTLTTIPPPVPNLGKDTCLVNNNTLQLNPHAPYAESYRWQDGSMDSTYKATFPGDYWVQAMNLCGTFGDTITILKTCDFPLYMPSAFTPNSDGRNDVFRILNMRGQQLIDFSVYNRWGQCVFKTSNPQKGWDGFVSGRLAETGTFVYIIHYVDLSGKAKYLKGLVNLIR